MKYVTRETGNLLRDSVEPRPDADSETGSGKRDRDGGSTDGVKRVASRAQTRSTRPTAGNNTTSNGSGSYGRKRPRQGTVPHGDDMAKTSVRSNNSLCRTDLNSTATQVNGSTSARSPTTPVDTQFISGTHTRTAARQLARPATPTHTLVHTRSRPYTPSDSHLDSQSDNLVDDQAKVIDREINRMDTWIKKAIHIRKEQDKSTTLPHLRQPVRPESERRTAIRQTVPKTAPSLANICLRKFDSAAVKPRPDLIRLYSRFTDDVSSSYGWDPEQN